MATTNAYRIEPSPRWVRAELNGTTVADSKRVKLLWEQSRLAAYCFPQDDVRMDLLRRSGERPDDPKGRTTLWTAEGGDRGVNDAGWTADPPSGAAPDLPRD